MTHEAARTLEADEPLRRVLGRVSGEEPGPTLVCIGGIHGNEPAGVQALRRVFATIASTRLRLRGELVGLSGNLAALARNSRYIDSDLNRRWRPDAPEGTGSGGAPDSDNRERHELAQEFEHISKRARGEVFVLDIHTTSGAGVPFLVLGDTLPNRAFAKQLSIPLILGLEEYLDGTISDYLTALGHRAVTVEAGQHDATTSIDNAEAAVWVGLAASGLIDAGAVDRVGESRDLLSRATRSIPRALEVRYRHPILPGDSFRMEPGFANFDPVSPGQLLARDRSGPVRSRWQGQILMPLYQELGNDGFFIVRRFRPVWLWLSAALRRARLDAIPHWLPGVSRHPTRPDTLVVDRKVARWFALESLHLLGFRRKRTRGDLLMVSRRMPSDMGKNSTAYSRQPTADA